GWSPASLAGICLTHPLQEKREIGLRFCGTEAAAIEALVQKSCVQVDRDVRDGVPRSTAMPPWLSALGPPCLTASRIWKAVAGAPTASMAKSTPPGLIAQIALTGSVFEALMPWVAPNSLANCSLRSTKSTAMMD